MGIQHNIGCEGVMPEKDIDYAELGRDRAGNVDYQEIYPLYKQLEACFQASHVFSNQDPPSDVCFFTTLQKKLWRQSRALYLLRFTFDIKSRISSATQLNLASGGLCLECNMGCPI